MSVLDVDEKDNTLTKLFMVAIIIVIVVALLTCLLHRVSPQVNATNALCSSEMLPKGIYIRFVNENYGVCHGSTVDVYHGSNGFYVYKILITECDSGYGVGEKSTIQIPKCESVK